MMPDHFIGHVADESVDRFHGVLQTTRTLHRKPRAHGNKKYRQQQYHEQFHREGVRDRRRGMFWMNVKPVQQRQHLRAEQTIQKCGKSQLFHFQILRLSGFGTFRGLVFTYLEFVIPSEASDLQSADDEKTTDPSLRSG